MRQFSTVELTQQISMVTHAAIKAPVAITQHRKQKFVLMAMEDYERLRAAADPRRVYRAGETPPDLAALVLEHIDTIIGEGVTIAHAE